MAINKVMRSVLSLCLGFGAVACATHPDKVGRVAVANAVQNAPVVSTGVSKTDYAPMKPFEALAGRTMRGTWIEADGKTVTDINHGTFILDGRAFEGTHKIEGSPYGGRTIIFYDEAAKRYIYHYFTTAGFHTVGSIELTPTGYAASEKVEGHPAIAQVASTLTVSGDTQTITVKYQGHDGTWTDAPTRTYNPYDGPKPFFR